MRYVLVSTERAPAAEDLTKPETERYGMVMAPLVLMARAAADEVA